MPKDNPICDSIIVAVLTLPLGIYYILKGFRRWSEYTSIVNTPTSRIGGVAMGFVEVAGKAAPKDQTFTAPISGKKCVFYRYTIKKMQKPAMSWSSEVVKEHSTKASFFVEDETGRVEVNPKEAEVDMLDKIEFRIYAGREMPHRVKELSSGMEIGEDKLSKLGPTLVEAIKRRYVYDRLLIEYVVEKGQKLFVTGTAVPKQGIRSDKHEKTLVIKKGDYNKFFYISDRAERGVLGRMKSGALVEIVLGALAALVGIALILSQLNML